MACADGNSFYFRELFRLFYCKEVPNNLILYELTCDFVHNCCLKNLQDSSILYPLPPPHTHTQKKICDTRLGTLIEGEGSSQMDLLIS
jgi:hypothetical protein